MSEINFVISGGGSRAIYAAGVAKCFGEFGIKINAISAVSGGSVVGAMLAFGYSPDKILEILKKIKFTKLAKLKFKKGIFSSERFVPILDELFDGKDVSYFGDKLFIWAIDLEDSTLIRFENTKISDAILASCSIYPIFCPYKIAQKHYIDGGFKNSLPAEPFVDSGLFTIGVNLNPKISICAKSLNLKRLIYTMFYESIDLRKNLCDFVFESPKLNHYSIFDTNHFDEMFELGYNDAKLEIEKIKEICNGTK